MLLVQWAIGLRPGEVCKMRLADLRVDAGEVTTPLDGKTGERRLYFDPSGPCAVALSAWIRKRPAGPYLFGGEKPVSVNTYYVTVKRYCTRAGVRRFRPYALRHTYATELLHEKQALSDISVALGHRSVATTAAFYLHSDPDMLLRLNKGR
jgi:integrase